MKKEYIIPIFVPHLGCPNDCTFCNQKSISGEQKMITTEDIKKTIDFFLENVKEKDAYKEVAFFGGSFTAIDEEKQNELLEVADEYIKNGKANSIRISTRPDYIDKNILKRLKKYKGTSTNMNALRVLAESNTDYIFRVSNEDINGMKFFEKGSDSNNPSNYKYGVTNMPNAENDASPDNNVYVYTADFLSELDQAKNVGHEAYGHAYFYELSLSDPTINPSHLKEKVGETIEIDPEFGIIKIPIFGNSNHKLEDQIDSVVNEVLKNYEERNR